MLQIPVIGIKGAAQSGKSSVAKILVQRFRFCELTFAEPFKHFIANTYGLSVEQLDSFKTLNIPGHSFTSRQAYQVIGEAFRSLDPNTWCDVLLRSASYLQRAPGLVVSDVRRINEADTVRGMTSFGTGGVILEVVRDQEMSEEWRSHVSETEGGFIRADYTVHNSDSFEELEVAVDKIVLEAFPKVIPHGRIGDASRYWTR